MVGFDRDALATAIAAHGPVVRVLVAGVEGSAPREPGAAMLVWATGQRGTIGGGALEWDAAARARALLPGPPWVRAEARLALGPNLGQCCGGAVRLVWERFSAGEMPVAGAPFLRPLATGLPPPGAGDASDAAPARLLRALRGGDAPPVAIAAGWIAEPGAPAPLSLFLYGAGHVGRALVRVLDGLPVALTWVDSAPARFPAPLPPGALPAASPADAVALAPDDAVHIVMTYSHAIDLEICHRVLARPFGHLGLIGSASKAARFRSRLAALGHPPGTIARLVCPIGDRALGKAPAAIAIGVAADLLRLPRRTRAEAVA